MSFASFSVFVFALFNSRSRSGTSLIGAPLEAVEAIYAQIPGSERYSDTFYSFPCSFVSSTPLPPLSPR